MALSFSGGDVEVRIFKGGQEYNKKNYPKLFNSITSVRAKVAAGNLPEITVEINPAYVDALDILRSGILGGFGGTGQKPVIGTDTKGVSSSNITSGGSSAPVAPTASGGSGTAGSSTQSFLPSIMPFIAVKFKYPGELDLDGSPAETSWYTGMMGVPDLSLGNGEVAITLHATPNVSLLTSLEGTISFKNIPLLDALKQLAAPVGAEIIFDENDTETSAMLSSKMISGIYNEPRLDTIRHLLFMAKCTYVIDSAESSDKKQLKVRSLKNWTGSKIGYTFVQFRQIDPNHDIIPVSLELVSPGNLFLAGAAFGTYSKKINTTTKMVEDISASGTDYDAKSMSGGESMAGALPKDDGSASAVGGSTGLTNTSDPNLTGNYEAGLETKDATNKDDSKSKILSKNASFLQFKLTAPGLHKLRAMSICQVIIGDNVPGLTGPILINSVEHVWDSNGWSTEIDARQTGGTTSAVGLPTFDNKPVENKPMQSSNPMINASVIA